MFHYSTQTCGILLSVLFQVYNTDNCLSLFESILLKNHNELLIKKDIYGYIFHPCSQCKIDLWLNLKNLSGGLNLSRGLNMVGSN